MKLMIIFCVLLAMVAVGAYHLGNDYHLHGMFMLSGMFVAYALLTLVIVLTNFFDWR